MSISLVTAEMTAFNRSAKALYELHQLELEGKCDGADQVRLIGIIESSWACLTESERGELTDLSTRLNQSLAAIQQA